MKTSWTWGAVHILCHQKWGPRRTQAPPFVIKCCHFSYNPPPCHQKSSCVWSPLPPPALPPCVIMTYMTWAPCTWGFWSISGLCIRRSFLLSLLDFWQIEVVQQSWWGYLHVAIRDAGAVMAIFFANTNLCFLPNIDIHPSSPLGRALIMEDACVNLLAHISVLSLII